MCARYKAALLKLSENCISKQSIYLKQFFFLSLYYRWPTDFESSCMRIKISVPSNDRSWFITECEVCFPASKSLCFGSATTAMFLLFWINEFVFVFIAITFSTQTILATRLSLNCRGKLQLKLTVFVVDDFCAKRNGTSLDFSCSVRLIRNRKFGIRVELFRKRWTVGIHRTTSAARSSTELLLWELQPEVGLRLQEHGHGCIPRPEVGLLRAHLRQRDPRSSAAAMSSAGHPARLHWGRFNKFPNPFSGHRTARHRVYQLWATLPGKNPIEILCTLCPYSQLLYLFTNIKLGFKLLKTCGLKQAEVNMSSRYCNLDVNLSIIF